jgi:hypothetical protein
MTATGWQDPEWRRWRVETIRRSLAMLTDGELPGLTRADAEALVNELQALERRLANSGASCGGWPRRGDVSKT